MKLRTVVTLIAVFALIMFVQILRAQDTREIEKTIALDKNGHVSVDTYKGSIDVDTWDKPEVKVYVRIEPDGFTREDRESARRTEIRFDSSSSGLRIETDYHEMHHDWNVFDWFDDGDGNRALVHYTITMPAGARLTVKDYKSETKISHLHADVEMNTYKGDVTIEELSGAADFETYKGDVRISYARISGENRIKNSKGKVTLELPADAGFTVNADFGRRTEFTSDFDGIEQQHSRRNEFIGGKVNDGSASIDLDSDKGDFQILKKKKAASGD